MQITDLAEGLEEEFVQLGDDALFATFQKFCRNAVFSRYLSTGNRVQGLELLKGWFSVSLLQHRQALNGFQCFFSNHIFSGVASSVRGSVGMEDRLLLMHQIPPLQVAEMVQ